MVTVRKENARLGQRVRCQGGVGRIDAITQSVVAILADDGRYVLARWDDGICEA